MLPVLYQGSVKNVRGEKNSSHYIFEYSDRYSIFDWGEMPDLIEGKGEALAVMADLFFRLLKQQGIESHSLGLVDSQGNALPPATASCYLKVEAIDVLRPLFTSKGYDYSVYQKKQNNVLVPLEVIFRMGVPKGSSLPKRLKENPSLLKEYALDHLPQEGEMFEKPLIEFSTKLEEKDRYLTFKEAMQIAGMSEEEMAELKKITEHICLKLKDIFSALSLELWDGKFEFSFTLDSHGVRSFKLVDAIGLDELRVLYKEIQISKEYLRQYYRESAWYQDVQKAQEMAILKKEKNWKIYSTLLPQKLPEQMKKQVQFLYQSFTNVLCEKAGYPPVFSVPAFADILKELKP